MCTLQRNCTWHFSQQGGMIQLQTNVAQNFTNYQENNAYVLPCHAYLFTQQSLQQCFNLSYDQVSCWLRSVEEAPQILLLKI
jgi:hypothetical protein